MKRVLLILALVVAGSMCRAQISSDVLGSHNLSLSGTSPVKGSLDP